MGSAARQRSTGLTRHIPERLRCLTDALLGLIGDLRTVAKGPRDGGLGHPGESGDIVARDHRAVLLSKTPDDDRSIFDRALSAVVCPWRSTTTVG